jgi:hypothetical protein
MSPPEILLKTLSFRGGKLIAKDDGSGLYGVVYDPNADPDDDPHWQEGREEQYPYFYPVGKTLTIWKAKWLIPGEQLEGPFYVRGEGTEGYDFAEKLAHSRITAEGTEIWVDLSTNLRTSKGSFPQEVRYFEQFEIQWKIRLEGHAEWDAGASVNPIYVPLTPWVFQRYPPLIVVHFACASPED